MLMGYFIANGRKFEMEIFAGTTCRNNLEGFADHMGWKDWEFSCPQIGLHVKSGC